MGRELRDLLESNSLGADVRLISASDEAAGVLSEHAGEPSFINKLDAISLLDADVVMLAAGPKAAARVLELRPAVPMIDLSHSTEEHPRARLRAPMVETHDLRVPPDAIQLVAHPAAIALALFNERLASEYIIAHWIAHVFEPASERGAEGVEELQDQTTSLLTFKSMPKKVFDNQVSFSLLASLGEEAVVKLEDVEVLIERDLATLLQNARTGPMPSLRLVQAPVFHGYSFSIWVEFSGDAPSPEDVENALESDHVHVYRGDTEPPNNVGIAGEDGIAVGGIRRDRNNPHAMWFWVVADNLRVPAQNAMRVAQELL
jgi:aspartate-semialdehyde dehydrogenase